MKIHCYTGDKKTAIWKYFQWLLCWSYGTLVFHDMLMTSMAKNGTTQSVNETLYDIKQLKTHRWVLMYLKRRTPPVPMSNSQRCLLQSTGDKEISHTASCFVRHGVGVVYTVHSTVSDMQNILRHLTRPCRSLTPHLWQACFSPITTQTPMCRAIKIYRTLCTRWTPLPSTNANMTAEALAAVHCIGHWWSCRRVVDRKEHWIREGISALGFHLRLSLVS